MHVITCLEITTYWDRVVWRSEKGKGQMSFNDIFKSDFLENVTSVSVLDIVITLVLAFAIGLFHFPSS